MTALDQHVRDSSDDQRAEREARHAVLLRHHGAGDSAAEPRQDRHLEGRHRANRTLEIAALDRSHTAPQDVCMSHRP